MQMLFSSIYWRRISDGESKTWCSYRSYEAWAENGDFLQRDLGALWEKKIYDMYIRNVFEEEMQVAH